MTDWDVFWKFIGQLLIVVLIVIAVVFGVIEAWESRDKKNKDQ